jgi:phosphatidylglycerophosphate synthase
MLANWITLSRLPLLAISILALFQPSPQLRLTGVAVLLLGLFLDTVDGIVARKAQQTSLFGSVLDIAADRSYELVLWVCFAYFRMIPVAMPILVIGRTTLTDAIRSLGVGQGTAPFEQHRSTIGRFLVGSPIVKIGYSVTKITTFAGLALARALECAAWITGHRPRGEGVLEALSSASVLSDFPRQMLVSGERQYSPYRGIGRNPVA